MVKKVIALLFLLTLSVAEGQTPSPRTAESAVTPMDFSCHAGFLREIEEGNRDFDIVLIGDSITDWWPRNGAESYAGFSHWKPLNLGVASEGTEHVLYRITHGELDRIRPKVVMILIGTNNLGRSPDEKPEWTAEGVKKIVSVVRSKCPHAKILLLAILPCASSPDHPIRSRIDAVNRLIAPIANNRTVFFMNIGDRFVDAQGNLKTDLMPDQLHPNAAGYQLWMEAVKPTLSKLMQDSPQS